MKKLSPLIAALALTTFGSGCEKKDCLTKGYGATVQLIQEFNEGRCNAVFDEDRRIFECPSSTLEGEVNGRTFELTMSTPLLHYEFNRERLSANCVDSHAELTDAHALHEMEKRFKSALAQLEMD